jgi:pimeloyl-ACP methyl ester carboxylesterase
MTNGTEILHRLQVDDTEIEFSDRGTGEPLVLVHAGVFADWFFPVATSPALAGVRVIRLRRAGYLSGRQPAGHLTLRDHARHVGAVLDALGIATAHLCGHSSSCSINLQLAIDRPSCVATLSLIDPAPGVVLQAPSQQSFTASVARPALAAAASGDTEAAFDIWMAGVDADYRRVLENALGPDGYQRAVAQSRFFFADELPAIREWTLDTAVDRPTLLILGGDSPANFHDMVSLLAGTLPDVRVTTVEGAGHLMPLQDPSSVGQIVADFVRQHPIAG